MKKWILLAISLLFAGAVMGYAFFYVDNEEPTISLKDTPVFNTFTLFLTLSAYLSFICIKMTWLL